MYTSPVGLLPVRGMGLDRSGDRLIIRFPAEAAPAKIGANVTAPMMSPRRSDGMRGRRLRDGIKAGLIEFP
jgi:hypothetical protein